jgi:hypothetical protein
VEEAGISEDGEVEGISEDGEVGACVSEVGVFS